MHNIYFTVMIEMLLAKLVYKFSYTHLVIQRSKYIENRQCNGK